MSKRHYLAIKYMGGAGRDVELGPAFGHRVGSRFYWWHGPSYMTLPDKFEIVKDYGVIDSEDYAKIDAAEVSYARDFPWPSGIAPGGG